MVGYTLIYFQILHQPDKLHGVMVYCSLLRAWLNSICCSVEDSYILAIEISLYFSSLYCLCPALETVMVAL